MANEKLLVVEDAPDIRSLLKIYFTAVGYEVLTAVSGQEAIEICKKTSPHLVSLDINLPDMEGYEVARWLRQNRRTHHIPIVFVTARGEINDRLIGLGEVQAEYYIVKPFDIEEVHTIFKAVLDRVKQKNLMHPVTNLPTTALINDHYHDLLSTSGWELAQIHINGFESFRQAYGVVAGEDVLRFTALLTAEVISELGSVEDFIGHRATAPDFVVTAASGHVKTICERLRDRFDAEIGLHYNYKARLRGSILVVDEQGNQRHEPLMSLSIGVLTSDDGPFRGNRHLAEMAEDVRLHALTEAREQGRKSHVSYGLSRQSVGGGSPPALPPQPPAARQALTTGQVRSLLQDCIGLADCGFLAVQIEADLDVARTLFDSEAITIPSAQHVIALGDAGALAILATATIDHLVDGLPKRFETDPLAREHGARLTYGYARGPFASIDELIAAIANDWLARFPSALPDAIYDLGIFQLEPQRRELGQRYEQARKRYDACRKDLSAKRVGIDSDLQAEIDQLTAVVDHDLGSGLTSLKAVISQTLEQLPPSARHERSKLAWIDRQVLLCSAWKRSIAELGQGSLLQPRPLNLARWLQMHIPLLSQQVAPELKIDIGKIVSASQVQLDPQPLLVACLHQLLAARQAGASVLRISMKLVQDGEVYVLMFQDDGQPNPRFTALRHDLPADEYDQLPWHYQNLLLVRRVLEQQDIELRCRRGHGQLQISWQIPSRPADALMPVALLSELRKQVEAIEQEVEWLETLLCSAPSQPDASPDRLLPLLRPYVHELVECLRALSEHAGALNQAQQAGTPAPQRVQQLSLYCYLLVRNLALVLEGGVLPVEEVNVNDQIRQVIDLLNHKLTNISVTLDLLPDLPRIAIAPVEIKQVLMNLVKNAAEALGQGGQLSITTSYREGRVAIRVTDTGAGILPEHRDKIFQLNFSTKGKGANSGVGLYAVQSIAQGAGGEIAVASRARTGQDQPPAWVRGFDAIEGSIGAATGTVFEVLFPAVPKQARLAWPEQPSLVAGDAPSSAESQRELATAQVLIVDDDLYDNQRYCQLLRSAGYDAHSALNAEQAVQAIEERSFDAILLDMLLPMRRQEKLDFGGLELLRRIKARDHRTQVIAITGYGSRDLAAEAMAAGAFDYIIKDLDTDDRLPAMVHIAVARARQLQVGETGSTEPESDIALDGLGQLVANSTVMRQVLRRAQRLAGIDAPLLITGEAGVGKGLLANVIHRNSRYASGPFVVVVCGEINGDPVKLWGDAVQPEHGLCAQAAGGTLVLRDIQELSLDQQWRVVRLINNRRYQPIGAGGDLRCDLRVIATTTADLKRLVRQGDLAPALYAELSVAMLSVPPLRERGDGDDITAIAGSLLHRYRLAQGIAPDAIELIATYDYGRENINELERILREAAERAGGGIIELAHLPQVLHVVKSVVTPIITPLQEKLQRLWRAYLDLDSQSTQGNAAVAREIALLIAQAAQCGVIDPQYQQVALPKALLDTTTLFVDTAIPRELPLLVWCGSIPQDSGNRLWRQIRDALHADNPLALLVLPIDDRGTSFAQALQKKADVDARDLVIIGRRDLDSLLEARDQQRAFWRLVIDQVSLMRASVYQTEAPVTGDRFFGREQEIRGIREGIATTSFALIGTRLIGKTSILHRLEQHELRRAGYQVLYYNGLGTDKRDGEKNYRALLRELCRQYQQNTGHEIKAKTLSSFIDSLADRRPMVLLIDEADALLDADRACNWKLYGELRVLSQSGRCQCVLAGEVALQRVRHDADTPFFNFARNITIGHFDRPVVAEMLIRPMEQIGVVLHKPEQSILAIMSFTGGHPNVVQRLCARLVALLNQQSRRELAPEDTQKVINDPTFQRDDFLDTYFQRTSILERLVMLILAQASESMPRSSIRKRLNDVGVSVSIRKLEEALQFLVVLRGILEYTQAGYRCVVGGFTTVLGQSILAHDLLEELIERFAEEQQEPKLL